jgi:short-subunit dehydrogenase
VIGKHIVITGGSSGIGLAVARQLAARGSSITIIARDQTKISSVTFLHFLLSCQLSMRY